MPTGVALPAGVALADLVDVLRTAGARFAFLHGSRAGGASSAPRADSDLDVAAWFARDVASWEVEGLPAAVDLLVLDSAPLELAGRVAQHGVPLFDDDPPARVRWQAQTRKVWLDEQPRLALARRDFVLGLKRRAQAGGARG